MTSPAVRVEGLSKRYYLGAHERRYRTLRDHLAARAAGAWRQIGAALRGRSVHLDGEELWALDEVSFEVPTGEALGIVGHNGAGKSTLLKILSRITEPTAGRAEVRGRVGSLLEVGTGFHPELTGRENVFLNGAILGMKRGETAQRFDAIVAFAELDRFIDTPVKHYSSGMYMRLAFAVAAHLEPDVLFIDEVLAVGDAAFQRKCLGRIGNVTSEGRTVLFVSHNLRAVQQLCRRALWLQDGRLVASGPSEEIVARYLRATEVAPGAVTQLLASLPADPALRLESIALRQDGTPVERIANGRPLEIEIRYEVKQRTTGLRVFFDLCDPEGLLIFRSFHDEGAAGIPATDPGSYVARAVLPADLLAPVTYELRIHVGIYNVRMCTPPLGVRMPVAVDATGRYNRAYLADTHRGLLAPAIPWTNAQVRHQ
ncbi:MAG TPA: polysaccharide ABC transporter ATP-binding protein [Thermoanaerobaculia bacterium]|jgi:lipopolysaccharide transport system ATP-binding protein|nr:polysaccharide ABC transporter ATP-binding protein [Thermoanaerobaculia bacterium]